MLRWAFSFAMNRLFVGAIIIFLIHNYFRTSCGFGESFTDQFNRLSGFDQLYRVFDHDN